MRKIAFLAAAAGAAAASRAAPTGRPYTVSKAHPSQIDAGAPQANLPELLPYDPVANPAAVVTASDGFARFTVLTPRLLRMEYAWQQGLHEDRASQAVLTRNLSVPAFTAGESGGVLTITTAAVKLTYVVGSGNFTPASLRVDPVDTTAGFPGWAFGDPFPGNLLGTIRGLDMQAATTLNCSQNTLILDNGENNHCEWGLVSRDGWAIYDDSANAFWDASGWWSTAGLPAPNRTCGAALTNTDAQAPQRSAMYPEGTTVGSQAACCAACEGDSTCFAYVWSTVASDSPNCWPLGSTGGEASNTPNRVLGLMNAAPGPLGPQFNVNQHDLYGFFHGTDFKAALREYQAIGGRTPMVLRQASGVWWSRWFDISNADTVKIIQDYESRDLPVSTYVIDMNWHTKNDWSGFTFDNHLYPFPADTMGWLKAQGLAITVNVHDASGVNYWEAKFPALAAALGLPANATVVPMNLVNASVAYAVEDIVIGDLLYNQLVDFMWIDWQQGGDNGGMTGAKQNPTFMLAHLRCTDRHRAGDVNRAMVLSRWGGMGHHRYQVGFSGDVGSLSWGNLAYQPYFSATAANVLHPFWSHDLEGPPDDLEMYVRWMQVGSWAGVTRSHDRGMSGGGCSNTAQAPVPAAGTLWGPTTQDCSVVEPWNVGPVAFEAIRGALRGREALLPYVYNTHRQLFDTGLGLIRGMYLEYPTNPNAYRMDGSPDDNKQYMFGDDMIVAPVVAPAPGGDPTANLAPKTVWLPDGAWYDAIGGRVVAASGGATMHTRGYRLSEVPLFVRAGAVVPYLPLRSLPTTVGNGGRQYGFLGFRVYPGAAAGSGYAYEDDGQTTAYLTGAWMNTTCAYSVGGDGTVTVTIASSGAGYPSFPASRAYQLRLLNLPPPASVALGGGAGVPFVRYGALASKRTAPPTSQWYFHTDEDGMGVVVDVVGVPTGAPLTVTLAPTKTGLTPADFDGVYGAVTHAVAAKYNLDVERTTPGANTVMPSYTSVLSATGEALAYLAGTTDYAGFAAAVRAVPALLVNGTAEIGGVKSPRTAYSVALLQAAAV